MSAKFNHTIIAARDPKASAEFYRALLEAEEAPSWGPFTNLLLDDRVLLQFADPSIEFHAEVTTSPSCSTTITSFALSRTDPCCRP